MKPATAHCFALTGQHPKRCAGQPLPLRPSSAPPTRSSDAAMAPAREPAAIVIEAIRAYGRGPKSSQESLRRPKSHEWSLIGQSGLPWLPFTRLHWPM